MHYKLVFQNYSMFNMLSKSLYLSFTTYHVCHNTEKKNICQMFVTARF